jgi:hemerythrin
LPKFIREFILFAISADALIDGACINKLCLGEIIEMALLNWSRRRYTVGVAKLDDQHATFIGCLNKLHEAMTRGQGKAITGPLLQALIANALEHTAAEEEFMSSANYPGLARHREEHRKLVAKFEELKALHERGEDAVCIPLLQFMRDWLANHVLGEDREGCLWIRNHESQKAAQPHLASVA